MKFGFSWRGDFYINITFIFCFDCVQSIFYDSMVIKKIVLHVLSGIRGGFMFFECHSLIVHKQSIIVVQIRFVYFVTIFQITCVKYYSYLLHNSTSTDGFRLC